MMIARLAYCENKRGTLLCGQLTDETLSTKALRKKRLSAELKALLDITIPYLKQPTSLTINVRVGMPQA
ncbi:MAG: hypothetical protein A2X77_03955 [Gammaproteobacteria bacterium GWE2_42_36]|nr:MAG: hypothetical protein A2X77_03955 [Gammaproteobacteria bacterium GWE2_42_36]HCU04979.1 hypothetical protein [Coxiellaceae bacterium]